MGDIHGYVGQTSSTALHLETIPQDTYPSSSSPRTVAVIGFGSYGRAFASRLASCSVPIVVGARNPQAASSDINAWGRICDVLPIDDALKAAQVIILALPDADYESFVSQHGVHLRGKILVDVANPITPGLWTALRTTWPWWSPGANSSNGEGTAAVRKLTGNQSSAERLQLLLAESQVKDCSVVKAFNNISAYELEHSQARIPLPVASVSSDDEHAKTLVMNLAKKLRLNAVDFGGIDNAIIQERTVHRFFDGWTPVIVFGLLLLLGDCLYFGPTFFAGGTSNANGQNQAPIQSLFWQLALMPLADVATVCLCAAYLPGPIAAFWQLARGTSRRPFPAWFASWLNVRKQLGLFGFFLGTIHGLNGAMEGYQLNPMQMTMDDNGNMVAGDTPLFATYLYATFGPIVFALYGVLAACSVLGPAQGLMSWMEWQFVFVFLGYLTIGALIIHSAAQIPQIQIQVAPVSNKGSTIYFPIVVAGITLLLKVVTILPPLAGMIARVRRK